MVNVILTHEVQDYAQWRKAFDTGEQLRSQNGVSVEAVYTTVDNPNKVTVATAFPSVEAVQGFRNNPQLKTDMESGGVKGVPEVKILNKM